MSSEVELNGYRQVPKSSLDEGAAELAHWCRRRRYWLPVVPR
ncbi:hypothetical protein [Mycobacterium sp.]|nr:hypothetical protein [Mycobacterium sp.]